MNLDLYKDATWNGASFWHGTSTIFLDSIKKNGLGAINPGRDLKLLELLTFLYDDIKQKEIWHQVLDINRASIEAAIAQTDMHHNGTKLNYRHEGVYVGASALRAAYYAALNKVGSELLEKCLILLSVLINENQEPVIREGMNSLNIRQYLEVPAKPIMIEVMHVPDDELVLEDGTDAAEMLRKLRVEFPKLPVARQFEELQFCNFRLLKPIPTTSLRLYEVEFEGDPRGGNFEYFLTRIKND